MSNVPRHLWEPIERGWSTVAPMFFLASALMLGAAVVVVAETAVMGPFSWRWALRAAVPLAAAAAAVTLFAHQRQKRLLRRARALMAEYGSDS